MTVIVWEFCVPPGLEPEFQQRYGPDGDWARLFARARGFVRTELLRDGSAAGRYLTLDYWESPEAFDKFKRDCAAAYAELDRQCESLTTEERQLGIFRVVE